MKSTIGEVLQGPAGIAAEVFIELEDTDRPELKSTIATWHLYAPGQSPGWNNFHISMIHLRPVEGERSPVEIMFEGATHEICLYALNPERNPDPVVPDSWLVLIPVNFQYQFAVRNDEDAKKIARLAAQAVVDGKLWAEPPFSGQTEPWASAIDATAEHIREGHHDDD